MFGEREKALGEGFGLMGRLHWSVPIRVQVRGVGRSAGRGLARPEKPCGVGRGEE